MRYALIARHLGEYPLRRMCRVFEVSPAGYYASRTRAPSARAIADERLLVNVRVEHAVSDGTYGAPRIQRELAEQGHQVSTKRIARLMREDGLVARRGRGVRTTDSRHAHPVAPNLLERRFDVHGVRVNEVWVSDLTSVPTDEGWLYLATVLDLASRRVVGWDMRDTLDGGAGARAALRMAIAQRRPPAGLIHHSDRGSQYACGEYQALLAQHGMRPSMSRKGDCWDNAVAESFFATLEQELIARRHWATRQKARRAIVWYIESWYNLKRRHSTLGYVSPAIYEAQRRAA